MFSFAVMAQGAPIGNKFWLQRATHGRAMLFASPTLLWEAACEYFDWCEANPLIEVDFRGKDATQVAIPKMRAMTITGLCGYLDCNSHYLNELQAVMKTREDETSKDFSAIITRIKEVLYTQKFTGAAAGLLNANIIARDLGLRDGTDVTTQGERLTLPMIVMADGTQIEL